MTLKKTLPKKEQYFMRMLVLSQKKEKRKGLTHTNKEELWHNSSGSSFVQSTSNGYYTKVIYTLAI